MRELRDRIHDLGDAGKGRHAFGEGAQAHHVCPVKDGGTDVLANCVNLCASCHYSAHEGGNYRFGSIIGRARAIGTSRADMTRRGHL